METFYNKENSTAGKERKIAYVLLYACEYFLCFRKRKACLRVWSVNSEGYYVGRIPVEYEDGWFRFHVGPEYPGMYYLNIRGRALLAPL